MTGEAGRALAGLSTGTFEIPSPRRARQYEALAEVALTALQETDLDTVLGFAAEHLRDALGCDVVTILDSRVSASGLHVRSGVGWPEGVVGTSEVADGPGSMAGYSLQVDASVLVDDLALERRFKPEALQLEHGLRSGLSSVIAGDHEPVGVLHAGSVSVGYFDTADLAIVESYAKVLSIAIRQHEREQLSADFAAIAAHELRTPLTLLIGYSSRLLRHLDAHGTITTGQREELDILYSESLRLRRATEVYLALGEVERRGASPQLADADLVAIVRAVMAEVQQRYPDAALAVEAVTAAVPWSTDEVAVSRVISNLVENGVKYSPRGSEVTVRIVTGETGADISVSDRCGGLSEDDFGRLFGRSFRGGHAGLGKGLGLGLYVSQRLSERIGASLTAENQGEGCVFTLHLPMPSA